MYDDTDAVFSKKAGDPDEVLYEDTDQIKKEVEPENKKNKKMLKDVKSASTSSESSVELGQYRNWVNNQMCR